MKSNADFLRHYIGEAPLALALERALECRLYARLAFDRPILDIGCGEGLFAEAAFGERIDTGIDLDPVELARARERGAYLELLQCDGARIPKPDGAFRTVFSNSVLEHIPDVRAVLAEAYRLLAPGGNFYFTVPSPDFERYTWINLALETCGLTTMSMSFRKFFNRFWRHHHAYDPAGWTALGHAAGFDVVEAFTYDPRRICLINTALTPFALPSKFIKNAVNRWHLFPSLRRAIAGPIAALAAPLLRGGERASRGGLVFVALRKP